MVQHSYESSASAPSTREETGTPTDRIVHGLSARLNGTHGAYTRSDDVKPKANDTKRSMQADLLDRLVVDLVGGYVEGLLDRGTQMAKGGLQKRVYPQKKPVAAPTQPAQKPQVFQPLPKKPRSKPKGASMGSITGSFTYGGGSGRPRVRREEYTIDVGLINTPPTGTAFATLTGYLTPHPSHGQYYEDSRGYNTVRVLEASVELIPNDVGAKENIANGRWLVVGQYNEIAPVIPTIGQARCFAPVEGAIHERVEYIFTPSRLGRECQIPTGSYQNTYENTPATFVIGVARPTGTGVVDYAAIGRWRLKLKVEFMDPACTKERFGRLYMSATGGAGATPLGTALRSYGVMGYLRGSTVDIANRKITLVGLNVGDNIKVTLHSDGTAAAVSISTGNTISGLAAANLTYNGGADASSYVVGQGVTTARAVACHYYTITGDLPYIVISAGNTWPTAATITLEVEIIGVNIDETKYNTTVYSSHHEQHLCAQPAPADVVVEAIEVRGEDICPVPEPEHQEPDLELGEHVMLYPVIEDQDVADELSRYTPDDLKGLVALMRAQRAAGE